jgi:hypothetical protein
MTVFLTEEPSMRVTLEGLIARHFPLRVKAEDWMVIEYEGKSDLEGNISHKMRGWTYGNPLFVILRDADGGDCVALKRSLEEIALPTGGRFIVRIVCQELESWFIADSHAVTTAYPDCQFTNDTAKYRNPDRLNNASQELHQLTRDRSKPGRAARIAPHMEPARNRSRSFQVLFATLQQLLA